MQKLPRKNYYLPIARRVLLPSVETAPVNDQCRGKRSKDWQTHSRYVSLWIYCRTRIRERLHQFHVLCDKHGVLALRKGCQLHHCGCNEGKPTLSIFTSAWHAFRASASLRSIWAVLSDCSSSASSVWLAASSRCLVHSRVRVLAWTRSQLGSQFDINDIGTVHTSSVLFSSKNSEAYAANECMFKRIR